MRAREGWLALCVRVMVLLLLLLVVVLLACVDV
jgi:hypothetical protein